MKKIVGISILALLLSWVFSPSFKVSAGTELVKKVEICHATDSHNKPYTNPKPKVNAIVNNPNGHHYHNGGVWYAGIADHSWGDIIPSFEYYGCPIEEISYTFEKKNKNENITCSIGKGKNRKWAKKEIFIYPGKNLTTEGQDILNNGCLISGDEEPTPTPTPTDEPTITPTPTDTPDDEPTPTPTEAPEGKTSSLGYDISCNGGDFTATFDLKENGVGTENEIVSFSYNGLTKQDTTNVDGRASVSFPKQGNYDLKATANNGYSSKTVAVNMPQDCSSATPTPTPEIGIGGVVLGASTQGQVLGVSTMANTGLAEDAMALSSLASGIVLLAHAQKKKN